MLDISKHDLNGCPRPVDLRLHSAQDISRTMGARGSRFKPKPVIFWLAEDLKQPKAQKEREATLENHHKIADFLDFI